MLTEEEQNAFRAAADQCVAAVEASVGSDADSYEDEQTDEFFELVAGLLEKCLPIAFQRRIYFTALGETAGSAALECLMGPAHFNKTLRLSGRLCQGPCVPDNSYSLVEI